jgi:hypothetical protein
VDSPDEAAMVKDIHDQDVDWSEAEPPSKASMTMIDRLRLLATRREEMWWEIGVLLDEIASMRLFPAPFEDFAQFAEAEIGLTRADAIKLRRVARTFSREISMRFGADRLDLLLQYLEASPRSYCAVDILRLEVLVHTTDGKDVSIPFTEISDKDLSQAVRTIDRERAMIDPSIPRDVAAERDRLAVTLAGVAPQVRVRVHRSGEGIGDYSLALAGVDPFNMEAVGKVLMAEGKALVKANKKQ